MKDQLTTMLGVFHSTVTQVFCFILIYLFGSSLGVFKGLGFDSGIVGIWFISLASGWGIITYSVLIMALMAILKTDKLRLKVILFSSCFLLCIFDAWRVMEFINKG